MIHALLPSFISDVIWPEQTTTTTAPKKLHPTSYLDGLRGIASVAVFFCHYTEDNHPYLVPTYGLNKDNVSSWIQLPFLRIVYSGRPMVHIFFVISGFVLSYKPLKAIRARDFDKCYTTLSSSAFRRPFRLFGPCIVSTFIIAVMIQLRMIYTPLPTVSKQFWSWSDAVFHSITWPWAWDFDLRPGYDVHLWSIPIEFAHSMLLFLTILMLARVRPLIRQSANVFLVAYSIMCGKWAALEFFAGMFLADLHIQRASRPKYYESIDGTPSNDRYTKDPWLHYGMHGGLMLAAIFTAGWPNFDAATTPGIGWLLYYTPSSFPPRDNLTPQKFWFAMQAIVMVWCSGELDFVKQFLERPFPQYCGYISYAIYIVHGPVLNMFQARVIGITYTPPKGTPGMSGYRKELLDTGIKGMTGIDTAFQRTLAWFLGLVFFVPLVFWAADVFWRLVDVPMIGFARKLENVCLDSEADANARAEQESHELTGIVT